MCKSNYRVKVDLSKFYDDVRRSSWVYVDTEIISRIYHLQNHITRIFDIKKDFHLLLNTGEYLPPNEDARVVKENETVLVIPGTGFKEPAAKPPAKVTDLRSLRATTNRDTPQQKQSVSISEVKQVESSDEDEQVSLSMETTNDKTIYLSMLDNSQVEENENSQSKTEISSNNLEETLPESETPELKSKRKRVRRKRQSKSNSTGEVDRWISNASKEDYKKPRIVDSVAIPNGKHIRFGDVEKMEFNEYDSFVSKESDRRDSKPSRNGDAESYWEKPTTTSSTNLSNLLALRQSSTPITFTKKKNNDELSLGSTNDSKDSAANVSQITKKVVDGLVVDPKIHRLLEKPAELYDIVAFKMLTIGEDYSPKVSEYVIAQVMEVSSDKSFYKFDILQGKNEIQTPRGGKFDIETDETEDAVMKIIRLDWSALYEPRLIYRP